MNIVHSTYAGGTEPNQLDLSYSVLPSGHVDFDFGGGGVVIPLAFGLSISDVTELSVAGSRPAALGATGSFQLGLSSTSILPMRLLYQPSLLNIPPSSHANVTFESKYLFEGHLAAGDTAEVSVTISYEGAPNPANGFQPIWFETKQWSFTDAGDLSDGLIGVNTTDLVQWANSESEFYLHFMPIRVFVGSSFKITRWNSSSEESYITFSDPTFQGTIPTQAVPEPGSLSISLGGLVLAACSSIRRKRRPS